MRTIVLFGGPSDERHVCVAEAQNVARALSNVTCWFWAPSGKVYEVSSSELLRHRRPLEAEFDPPGPEMAGSLGGALDSLTGGEKAFFIALGGVEGEDGVVQRMLEERSLPFTGSGSPASAAAFDKARAKELLTGLLPMPRWQVAGTPAALRSAVDRMLGQSAKVILKPVAGGSSCGVFTVVSELPGDWPVDPHSLRFPYLVEQYLEGRELTVGVIDTDGRPAALPVVEIEVEPGKAFDYAAKYFGGARELCPAPIPDSLRRAAQRAALTAHATLGCEGYSRTDLIAAADGVYFLELNSLPGLTAGSLFPRALAVAGIPLSAFLAGQLAFARRRSSGAPSKFREEPVACAEGEWC